MSPNKGKLGLIESFCQQRMISGDILLNFDPLSIGLICLESVMDIKFIFWELSPTMRTVRHNLSGLLRQWKKGVYLYSSERFSKLEVVKAVLELWEWKGLRTVSLTSLRHCCLLRRRITDKVFHPA